MSKKIKTYKQLNSELAFALDQYKADLIDDDEFKKILKGLYREHKKMESNLSLADSNYLLELILSL